MRVETFSTAEPPRLRIGLPSGDVRLETVDGDETTVEIEVRRRRRRRSFSGATRS